MAILFDISSFLEEQPDPEPTNVRQFPRDVSAQCDMRHAQRMVELMEHNIETCDPNSKDTKERVSASIAPGMLEFWREKLEEAKRELAAYSEGSILTYRGKQFTEMAGRA